MCPLCIFLSFRANAYSSFVIGCKKTGKSRPTNLNPFLNMFGKLHFVIIQSFSIFFNPISLSLIKPPTKNVYFSVVKFFLLSKIMCFLFYIYLVKNS